VVVYAIFIFTGIWWRNLGLHYYWSLLTAAAENGFHQEKWSCNHCCQNCMSL